MKRIVCFVLINLFLISISSVQSDNVADKSRIDFIEDSLYKELDAMPRDSLYLHKIIGLELLFMESPKLLYYAELKEKEAWKQNRLDYVCGSYSDRAIYYANEKNIDSFYYWKRKMDPLALKEKEFNYYFFLCNLEVSLLIEQSKIETAILTAKAMYETAKEYDSVEGLVASNMSMGNAFLNAKRYSEATEAFKQALSLIPPESNHWKSWKVEILTKLVDCCELSEAYLEGLDYADQKQIMMDAIQEKDVGSETKQPFLVDQWVSIQVQKSFFYSKLNRPAEALSRLNDVKQYYPELSKKNQMKYHSAVADYYEVTGDYKKALSELDLCYPFLIQQNIFLKPKLIKQKATLLTQTGNQQEAIQLYNDLIVLKDSLNDAWLGSQLSEMRAIYEYDHLKLVNSELELQNKHTQLKMATVLCTLAILTLIIISILYFRLSKTKKELEYSRRELMNERDQLVQSKENLRIAKDKAEEARDLAQKIERKDSFFANMNHEIRTPLNAIVGFSNLLISEDDISPDERVLFINTINQNCEQLLKLVNDVLDLSRMESGKMQFSFGSFDLTEIVSQVYNTHKMQIPENLDLLQETPTTPIFACVDTMRLKQVLSNFINNAVKFTQAGYIKIGYELHEDIIIMYVEDTGRGIPEEHQKKIFERFYKQNDSDQGTGLGLSICSVIAEKLGGRLELISKVGKGSRFSILIPYDDKLNKAN